MSSVIERDASEASRPPATSHLRAVPGALLVVIGAAVMAGWWLQNPFLVRLRPAFPPMVFNTALCFFLAGIALSWPFGHAASRSRAQSLTGGAIAAIAVLVLAEHVLKTSLGIDWARLHSWLPDSSRAPGRMSAPTAFAFLMASAVLLGMNATRPWMRLGLRILTFLIGTVGALGLVGYAVHAQWLFPGYYFAAVSVHTAVCLVLLSLALRFAWRSFDWARSPLFAREDDRITFIGASILALVAVSAGIASFAVLQDRAQALVGENVAATREHRTAQLLQLMAMRTANAEIAAASPEAMADLRVIAAGLDSGPHAARVQADAAAFLGQGFSALSYLGPDDKVLASAGSPIHAPAMAVELSRPPGAQLLWNDGFVLRHRKSLQDARGTIGTLVTEQPLPILTRSWSETPEAASTMDMGLCTGRKQRLECFPQRLNPRVFSTALVNVTGEPLPMTRALRGESGIVLTRDYREQNVIASYGPVADTGLGMVVKMDTAEVFQPIREQLQIVAGLLLLVVAAGTLLLRVQVKPLAKKLIDAEVLARERGDQARIRLESALHERETALHRAQQMAGLAHVVTGPGGEFESWSETLPPLIGATPEGMPRSTRDWLQRIHPEERERFRTSSIEAERQRSRAYFEYRLRHGNGDWIHLRQVAEPIDRGAPGEGSVRWFSTIQDVTAEKRVEEEIRRLNAELELRVAERTAELQAANRELEAFSYTVSHDLRAPLRSIDGFSRILEREHREQLTPEARKLLDRVKHNARVMSQLIEDLLAFSRLGRQTLKMRKAPLKPLVEECLAEIRDEIEARKVRIEVGELPVWLCDSALLAQVFHNLIGNALKYTRREERPFIEVGSRMARGEAAIFVRDNGVGFDMAYADKLFGVFQRLHPATEFEGTGVGLAIVQRIVQRHGGMVWAESKPGEGAMFWFTLPQP